MNELWLRVALVAGALAITGVIIILMRRRAAVGVRNVSAGGLDSGVYFFSAATCATCEQARAKLDSTLGVDGYEEFTWEREPEAFAEYGVEQVPAVMVVDEGGRGRVYRGQPDHAMWSVS
jgi:hypothetical protein